MISQVAGAAVRALAVVVVIATPSLLIPGTHPETTQIVTLIALFAAGLVYSEYAGTYPGLIEFRDAPPFNRVRVISIFVTLFLLSLVASGGATSSTLTLVVNAAGFVVGKALEFPYSPLTLVLDNLGADVSDAARLRVQIMAGIAALVGLVTLSIFAILIRMNHWPSREQAFNVWINLPTFDPTTGGDVVARLTRDSRINVLLGLIMPYFLPVVFGFGTARMNLSHHGPPAIAGLGGDVMVLPSGFTFHARHGDGPDCRYDRSAPSAPDSSAYARGWVSAGLIWLCLTTAATADPLRIAVFHTDLERSGPGLLLRDILRGEDEQVAAVVDVIAAVDPDILLLLGFDYDAGLVALVALADRLEAAGSAYPHRFALRPNAGWPTGVDIDGDGTWPEPQDAHGYGRFNGEGGMALLSRLEIAETDVRDFSGLLWRDLPFGQSHTVLSNEAAEILRLSTMGIWDVPVVTGPDTRFHLLAIHAGPPVFDGPEDRNGIRNEDETSFFLRYLNGWSPDGQPFEAEAFAVLGTLNVDPDRGEGRPGAVTALLSHPMLQDPVPRDPDGRAATTNWDEPSPGRLRVDYILPAAGLEVTGAGIHGLPDDPSITAASGHRLVWMDVILSD